MTIRVNHVVDSAPMNKIIKNLRTDITNTAISLKTKIWVNISMEGLQLNYANVYLIKLLT